MGFFFGDGCLRAADSFFILSKFSSGARQRTTKS
jgi:hypothetical protein